MLFRSDSASLYDLGVMLHSKRFVILKGESRLEEFRIRYQCPGYFLLTHLRECLVNVGLGSTEFPSSSTAFVMWNEARREDVARKI